MISTQVAATGFFARANASAPAARADRARVGMDFARPPAAETLAPVLAAAGANATAAARWAAASASVGHALSNVQVDGNGCVALYRHPVSPPAAAVAPAGAYAWPAPVAAMLDQTAATVWRAAAAPLDASAEAAFGPFVGYDGALTARAATATAPPPRDAEELLGRWADVESAVLRLEHLDFDARGTMYEAALAPFPLADGHTAHVYASRRGASALRNHTDTTDVLVLQLSGAKEWRHCRAKREAKCATYADAALDDLACETVVLEPGDALFLPRGVVHGAVAVDAASVHLTIGLGGHRCEARRQLQDVVCMTVADHGGTACPAGTFNEGSGTYDASSCDGSCDYLGDCNSACNTCTGCESCSDRDEDVCAADGAVLLGCGGAEAGACVPAPTPVPTLCRRHYKAHAYSGKAFPWGDVAWSQRCGDASEDRNVTIECGTFGPTSVPTAVPSSAPSFVPTPSPTALPSSAPTPSPTSLPIPAPTVPPSSAPTKVPISAPTSRPTVHPSPGPTTRPTWVPWPAPTTAPTPRPSPAPIPS